MPKEHAKPTYDEVLGELRHQLAKGDELHRELEAARARIARLDSERTKLKMKIACLEKEVAEVT